VNDGTALIEQPQGKPAAVGDCATGLRRVAGGFEGAGHVLARSAASLGSWEGQASMAFAGHAAGYQESVAACDRVLVRAQAALARYQDTLEQVRQRISDLRDREEECIQQIAEWKRRLADAEQRAAAASDRMMSAGLDFGIGGGGVIAAQLQAQDDLGDAQDDAQVAKQRIADEREELARIRERARDARDDAERAEQAAAGTVRSLAGELPDVQFPGGPASPSAMAGTAFGPLASPFARDPRWRSAMARAAANDDEEEDNSGNVGDFFSGGINELTFGAVDLGGDKDSDSYQGGQIASYVPWNPVSAVKSAGTGVVKLGGKALKKSADNAAETGARRGADDAAGAGRRGDGAAVPPERKFWKKSTDFEGHRVHQRDDLIDPVATDPKGRTNMDRMEKGLAPLGPDGKPVNLHHTTQRDDGALAEVGQTFHQRNHRVIHINPNSIPSGIDRAAFDGIRERYWMHRADDFRPAPFQRELEVPFKP